MKFNSFFFLLSSSSCERHSQHIQYPNSTGVSDRPAKLQFTICTHICIIWTTPVANIVSSLFFISFSFRSLHCSLNGQRHCIEFPNEKGPGKRDVKLKSKKKKIYNNTCRAYKMHTKHLTHIADFTSCCPSVIIRIHFQCSWFNVYTYLVYFDPAKCYWLAIWN